ncbi:aminoacyl tRNA synthase complex-interacting multifunctional protein 2-like isoform X2 [Hyposmocoma kahamanoa]|uniref:aminoacyl tRNA synthase complex-interacting multifunctional protein 2-like isoform X2 n=1 Tax=Hyposmocoma kahamanoa TaxID=1477025 RepID=UPI000E6D74CB|nr:aminoacyl tRNA synthase complex-interacting multifunctional protein 2-like isoform X2 [Hyposmocoma kahamanoa]
MMYRMKKIITYDDEIVLPTCMYRIKNPNDFLKADEANINISEQGPNRKMAELEERQDKLLKKLDILYDRIKTISSICSQSTTSNTTQATKNLKQTIPTPEEIVVVLNPENLPWFLKLLLKESNLAVNVSWHIHSSVPNEKVAKIKAFVNKLKTTGNSSKINLRLIFRYGSADSELKLSSLGVPIVGNVNILRYLSYVYPSTLPYDPEDYYVDYLLDLCHLLERTPEKNKDAVTKKIFAQHKSWIYKDEFSIVDGAVYNVVKQWQNSTKYVPKSWFDKCEKKFL